MTTGKAWLLTAAVVGVVAVGVVYGPAMADRLNHKTEQTVPAVATADEPAPAPVKARKARPAATAARTTAPDTADRKKTDEPAPVPAVTLFEPKLHARLKPVMNRGTKMELAADGFKNAEQFATVAHAAHNTDVPFVVLKHRVLDEGQSLADAIRASKPDADVKAEVARATEAAKADIAAVSSN